VRTVPGRRRTSAEDHVAVRVAPNLSIALAVRWYRHDHGPTQGQLAKRVGVSQQQIAKLERVESNVTLRTLSTVASAFDHTVNIELEPA